MTIHIKWSAFFLLVYFALFLNAGRIVTQLGWHITINPIVYPLGILATLAILLKSKSNNSFFLYKAICLIVVTYTIIAVYLQPTQGIVPELHLLSYLAEIFLLITLILLTYHFSCALGEIELAMEDFLLNHIQSDVQPFTDIQENFEDEVYRCRRNNQAFQLIIVEMLSEAPKNVSRCTDKNRLSEDMLNYLANRYESNKMGVLLSSLLRRTDILAEQMDRKRFVLLCPSINSPIPQPNALRQRIKKMAWEQLKIKVICGVATFPDDSLIFEELMEKAELQLVDNSPLELINEEKNTILA